MLIRILKYSIKNILRNKFLSISSILVLTLLMFFINILYVMHDVSAKLIEWINSKLTISLYLNDDYDKNKVEIIDLIEDIKKIPWWINVDYRTKEQILDEIRLTEPDLANILERTNPLPDTIVLSEIGLEQFEQLNAVVENKIFVLSTDDTDQWHFSNYSTQYKKIEQVIWILNILELWLYIIIIVFLVSIAIIIYSIIGNFIYYYKDEIYITKLVGWSNQFIYWPFVIQWSIYSFVSFLLSLIVFIFIIQNTNSVFGDFYNLYISPITLFYEMFIFVLIGWISGFFSSRKYLK